MSEGDDDAGVTLGPGAPVEGAPLARVSARLTWPARLSDVERLEGDTVIRTPEGPRPLSEVLEAVDETYFDRAATFEAAVRAVVGVGPVPTDG